MAIAPGTVGPGGAKFGQGSGGPNRFDHTQLYGGLWSIGIDPQSPTLKQDVQNWYNSQPANVKAEVQKGMGNQPGRGSIDPLVYAVDWRQRDVARKIQKTHGMFDFLGPLAPVGQVAATLAGAAIGNMILPGIGAKIGGTLVGGVTGGLQSKSVVGGLLGAAGGYGVGSSVASAGSVTNLAKNTAAGFKSLATNPKAAISTAVNNATTSAKNFIKDPLAGLRGALPTASSKASLANAVPGIRTGVTTPLGGGAFGAPLRGLQGGAKLGASSLAVAGGATPALIIPNAPRFGTVQPISTGAARGTTTVVGSPTTTATNATNTAANIVSSGTKELLGLAAGTGAAAAITSGAPGVTNTDSALAGLVREQDRYFNERVKPLEQAALAEINDPNTPRAVADRAGATARSAVAATEGMERRQLSRFGVRPTADQSRSMGRSFEQAMARADAGARNTAYGAAQDSTAELAGSALQIGRGVAGQSMQGLAAANSLSNARQTAANQAESATRAGRVNSMFTGAGLGAVFASGEGGFSPFQGAGIGAGVGLLASLMF